MEPVTAAPPAAGWQRQWDAEVRAALDLAEYDDPARMPHTVVSLVAGALPGRPWASLLFAPGDDPPLPDATSSPVMVGVFEADACSRRGPLRSLLPRTGASRYPATVHLADVADASRRWSRFTTALRRTSPDVGTLAYLPIAGAGAVLVIAAPRAHALTAVVAAGDLVVASVRVLLEAATASRSTR